MQSLREAIIDILLKNKRLSKERLEEAFEIQRKKQIPLRKVLVEQGFISEEELLSLLSEQLYIPTLHLAKYKFEADIIKLIPEHMARQYIIIPLSRIGNTLTVAVSDPLNIFALDDLKTFTGFNIDTVLSSKDEITKALDAQYTLKPKDAQQILEEAFLSKSETDKQSLQLVEREEIELTDVLRESEKAPIVKLVDLMLNEALKRRASDIHIEPEIESLRIRYRIDGALHEAFKVPRSNQNAVLARIKIISDLDITENRLPQDGRFKVKFENREIDFRVSALPITFGQKFVLRVLDKSNLSTGLNRLGFSEQPMRVFKEAIAKPFGMILVTGPTGSGKSTTLYSILNQLNTPDKNIVTIEDPVEYQIEGITQVQVKPEVKLDFASGLRSILRQSPDIIMIGEIRDAETADIAIKASLTGQLVFSTLHTNDAISSISRLLDMNIEPFLVSSSLIMLCAQRLCRRICLKCRKPDSVSLDFVKNLGFIPALEINADFKEKITVYESVGCKYCNNTGFYGRIALLEAVMIDDIIREMIAKKDSIDEIKKYAVEKCGMKILRDDAYLKVKEGATSLNEALRITTEE